MYINPDTNQKQKDDDSDSEKKKRVEKELSKSNHLILPSDTKVLNDCHSKDVDVTLEKMWYIL